MVTTNFASYVSAQTGFSADQVRAQSVSYGSEGPVDGDKLAVLLEHEAKVGSMDIAYATLRPYEKKPESTEDLVSARCSLMEVQCSLNRYARPTYDAAARIERVIEQSLGRSPIPAFGSRFVWSNVECPQDGVVRAKIREQRGLSASTTEVLPSREVFIDTRGDRMYLRELRSRPPEPEIPEWLGMVGLDAKSDWKRGEVTDSHGNRATYEFNEDDASRVTYQKAGDPSATISRALGCREAAGMYYILSRTNNQHGEIQPLVNVLQRTGQHMLGNID